MTDRTWSMKVNEDGTVTASYAGVSTTFPAPEAQGGRRKLRYVADANRPGHDTLISDDGQKTTLTCACKEFTAICETGTAEERAASVEYASHASKVDRARSEARFRALFNPKGDHQ